MTLSSLAKKALSVVGVAVLVVIVTVILAIGAGGLIAMVRWNAFLALGVGFLIGRVTK